MKIIMKVRSAQDKNFAALFAVIKCCSGFYIHRRFKSRRYTYFTRLFLPARH